MSVRGKFLGGVGGLLDVVVQVERPFLGLGKFEHLDDSERRNRVALHPLLNRLDRQIVTASLEPAVQLATSAKAGHEFSSVDAI